MFCLIDTFIENLAEIDQISLLPGITYRQKLFKRYFFLAYSTPKRTFALNSQYVFFTIQTTYCIVKNGKKQ